MNENDNEERVMANEYEKPIPAGPDDLTFSTFPKRVPATPPDFLTIL